jgi:hypothetical protein
VKVVVAVDQAVELRSRWLGPNHPATVEALLAGVSIASSLHDHGDADRWSREAYQRSLRLPNEHPQRRSAILARVGQLRQQGHHSLARLTLADLPAETTRLADPLAAWQLYEQGRRALGKGAAELARHDFERAKLILLAHPDPELSASVERGLESARAGGSEIAPADSPAVHGHVR